LNQKLDTMAVDKRQIAVAVPIAASASHHRDQAHSKVILSKTQIAKNDKALRNFSDSIARSTESQALGLCCQPGPLIDQPGSPAFLPSAPIN
jgi:hypothetical protein